MRAFLKGVLFLTVLAMGIGSPASHAVDFKIGGQWVMNFDVGEPGLLHSTRNGNKVEKQTSDRFDAKQRIRVSLDAIASENLSASVQLQLGAATWGNAATGAALGADGTDIKVRWGYIDWSLPDGNLKTRMGLQYLVLPNKAGGTAVMATRIAAILSSWKFSDNVSLTGMWGRPYNDNYPGEQGTDGVVRQQNYLDNLDLFALMLPVRLEGLEITPWAMYGMMGRNTQWSRGENGPQLVNWGTNGYTRYTLLPQPGLMARSDYSNHSTGKAYADLFWAGLPIAITALDDWNFELDLNYGYVGALGRYDAYKGAKSPENLRRASTQRQGWIVKALAEYKFDWGKPGLFGWYASGDDGNPKNGSERMPSLAAYGDFTSFLGDNPYSLGTWYDQSLDYSGTWGIGARLRDLSFLTPKLRHDVRVAWWGGTNSPDITRYMNTAYAWNDAWCRWDGPYLTTNDGLLEFNLVSTYEMYENFKVQMEWGYIANYMDNATWNKAGNGDTSFSRQDAWKGMMKFIYSF